MNHIRPLLIIACLTFVGLSSAAEHVISQKDKQFSTIEIDAKVGDVIVFKNEDTVSHNIFSLSDAQSFDLGTYGPGQTRQLKLTAGGTIEVECAIHPNMKLKIKVAK